MQGETFITPRRTSHHLCIFECNMLKIHLSCRKKLYPLGNDYIPTHTSLNGRRHVEISREVCDGRIGGGVGPKTGSHAGSIIIRLMDTLSASNYVYNDNQFPTCHPYVMWGPPPSGLQPLV